MKKNAFLLSLLLLLATASFSQVEPKLIVYYFHATHRCNTCTEIEKQTKLLLDESFSNQLETGVMQFRSVDYEAEENKDLVNKYYAYGSTLLLVTPEDETNNKDLTDIAFEFAVNKPNLFLQKLAKEIHLLLK
ncbi:MAG: hypothetical protein KBB11_04835 [Bacteroidales bacterium]|nr:hypothetical protein [Bacteroidales bacterium]